MNICVIGTGYVGLVTGTVFSDLGNDVICVDKEQHKIERLKQGKMPIYEPGLEEMVVRNMADGRLSFSTNLGDAIKKSEIIFIAVGTPPKTNWETDLTAVKEVAQEIGRTMNSYKVVVNKSTVPVGTGDFVSKIIQEYQPHPMEFDVVSNPEFLREGSAIEDTLRPDRIVIGAPNQKVAMVLLELYAPLERPMVIVDIPSAEMIKYTSNAFLATKVSFVNAISTICERAGANIQDVIKGIGLDPRIGTAFLQAGLGFGGACLPKDTESLIHTAATFDYDFQLLKSVMDINRAQVPIFVGKMKKVLSQFPTKVIGILGLAFKPNTDDTRDAKSMEIIRLLHKEGATIRAYDPVVRQNAMPFLPEDVIYCESAYEAARGADAVILATEWNEFKFLDLGRLHSLMRTPILFDGRNLYEPEKMRRLGFVYYSIGRPPTTRE